MARAVESSSGGGTDGRLFQVLAGAEPGSSLEDVADALGNPQLKLAVQQYHLSLSPVFSYGNRGPLVGGSVDFGQREFKSQLIGLGLFSRKGRFTSPERTNETMSLGYLTSPDGSVRQFDATDCASMTLGGIRSPLELEAAFSTKIGTDEGEGVGFAAANVRLGLGLVFPSPDPKVAAGFYGKVSLSSGIGGGAEFTGSDADAFFDWETVRSTVALGGFW